VDPTQRLALAFRHRERGDLKAATDLALGLIDSPEARTALELAALCLLEARSFNELMTVLQLAGSRGILPPVLFARVLDNSLRTDRFDLIEAIATRIPPENPLYPLVVYYSGCARVAQENHAAALAIFTHFRAIIGNYRAHVPFDADDLNVLYRQGILVAGPDEVAQRLKAAHALLPAMTEFTLLERAAPCRKLVAACADAVYVARFAQGLLDSVAAEDALHLHVIDPTDATPTLLVDLAASAGPGRLGVSTSRDPHYGTATAYACARFFVLPMLLSAYDRPIVTVDIDLQLIEAFDRLDLDRPDYDFALFETARREPASLYAAGLMIATPTAAGRDFLTALGHYCLSALNISHLANWQLDQAALYSVKHYFAVTKPEFRFGLLNRSIGGQITDFIGLVTSDEEKYALRKAKNIPHLRQPAT
jgi:hypothetical protein